MTDQAEVKSVLNETDKKLLREYKNVLAETQKQVQKTEATISLLQRTIFSMLGTDKYWSQEAIRHIKLGMLALHTALAVEPNMEVLMELRTRAAKLVADTQALNDFNAAEQTPDLDPVIQQETPVVEKAQE